MQVLKADTAVKVVIGPVVAVGDGFTPVTTLSLSTADEAEIMKHDAAAVTDISSNTFAAITAMDGYYNLTITAAQLDTEGMLTVGINDDSLCLPVRHDFMVVNANVYDSLYGAATTDYLQVDTIQVGGTTQTARDLGTSVLLSSGTGAGQVSLSSGTVTVGTNNDKTGYSISGTKTTLDALNDVSTADVNAQCDTALTDYDGPTYTELLNLIRLALRKDAALATDLAALITTLNADLGSGVGAFANTTDSQEAIRDHVGDGTNLTEAGGDGDHLTAINLPDQTMNITGNITGNLSGSVGSVTGAVGSVTGSVGSVVGHTPQTGDSFARLGAPAGASISADVAAVKVDTAATLVDTAEIGAAGAGLTDLGGMSTGMKAEVLVEVLKSLTTQLTESYAANGTAPTLTQGIMAIHQMLMEFAISGTSLTVKKLDSTTTAFVVTLDDATSPTSNTR